MGNNNRAKVLLPFLCNFVTDCSRFGQQEIFKEIFKVVDSSQNRLINRQNLALFHELKKWIGTWL